MKTKKKKDPSVPLMTSAKAQAREKLTPHIGEWKQPPGAAAVDRSAAFRTRRLNTERDRPLQMATWGPTTVPRPGRTWISESQQMQTTLRDAEEIAANESDEFEVIEREKARKAFMINAQNERVTNKARERLAQLALHKYGGVRQMFECLDRNNDKELSLDEFSHALKRRNLEKLFPRRAARVLDKGRVDGVFMSPRASMASTRPSESLATQGPAAPRLRRHRQGLFGECGSGRDGRLAREGPAGRCRAKCERDFTQIPGGSKYWGDHAPAAPPRGQGPHRRRSL